MIREIYLEHFKCFERLSLPLGGLTLLSGVNASGKSTVVQSLALLSQSVVEAEWSGALLLDGASVQLGAVTDVVDKVNGRRSFRLGLAGDGFMVRWRFGDPDEQAREAGECQPLGGGEQIAALPRQQRSERHRLSLIHISEPTRPY